MRPERMDEITLLCKRDDADRVIDILADMKAVHITDHEPESVSDILIQNGQPRQNASRLSSILIRSKNLATKLSRFKRDAGLAGHDGANDSPLSSEILMLRDGDLDSRVAIIERMANEYAESEDRIQLIDKELERVSATSAQLSALEGLDAPLDAVLSDGKRHSVILLDGSVEYEGPAITVSRLSRSTIVLLDKKDVAHALERFASKTLDVSMIKGLKGTVDQQLSALAEKERSLRTQRYKLQLSQSYFAKHLGFVEETNRSLALELMKAQAPTRFGMTARLAVIKGFIPKKRSAEVETRLGERSVAAIVSLSEATDAPVLLDNKHARDFEILTRLYSLPRYDEIDPTSIMAFTFPLFFGFMLGDIGYGLAALGLFWLLSRKVPKIAPFCRIMMLSAVSAVFFGALYGEIFGATSVLGVALPSMIHRETSIISMLVVAVIIGAAHINLGLIIGIVNESRGGVFNAIMKKGGFIGLQASALFFAMAYGLLGTQYAIGLSYYSLKILAWSLLSISIAVIVYSERMKGMLELPMVFSNMLSYTRLVALGLSSVFLAAVINEFAIGLFSKGGLWLLLGVLVLVVGHAVNLALGLLGPFLHSLRLHYVEFFNKFYEGGGKRFTPFGEVSGGA